MLLGLPAPEWQPAPIEAEVPFAVHDATAEPGPRPDNTLGQPVVVPGGPRSAQNIDANLEEGAGLRQAERRPVVLMYASPADVSLVDSALNNLRVNQTQRIRTAADRATLEQRRSTPNPMDEVFLASGETGHAERRKPTRADAAHGAPRGEQPTPAGAQQAAPAAHEGGALVVQQAQLGSDPVRARGLLGGRGKRYQRAARVQFARPDVDRGPAATPAHRLDSRIRDDEDAELLAAELQRSLVEASVRGQQGQRPGLGGDRAGTGSGTRLGSGLGGKARPYKPGPGSDDALDTRDARYVRWFAEQRARVANAVIFPTRRALMKDQGTSLYRVVVRRDGKLESAPRLLRSSGYADLDAAARAAIRKAAPFAPLPPRLAPELAKIAIVIPVEFANPMFQ